MFRIVSCNKVNLPANFVNNFMQNRGSKEMKNCSKKQIILSTNQNSCYLCVPQGLHKPEKLNPWYFFNNSAKFAAFSTDLFSSLKFKVFYFVIVAFFRFSIASLFCVARQIFAKDAAFSGTFFEFLNYRFFLLLNFLFLRVL